MHFSSSLAKTTFSFLYVMFLAFSTAFASAVAADVAPLYPQYRLTPASPTTADSVSFWLVRGQSGTSCYPRYSTSFRFDANSLVAATVIVVTYKELKLGIACMPLYNSVEYGPRFSFGKLPAGTYTVFDSTSNTFLTSFSVTFFVGRKDTVRVSPQSPTPNDSLDFSLYAANLGCGGKVHNDMVVVSDTCIYLSFSYEECMACACISMGQWISFHSKPLKAGTYTIYKQQNVYCAPGTPCPLYAIMPMRLGQVTVRPSTAVLAGPVAFNDRATVSFERSSKLIMLSLPSAQSVSLELYGLNGKKIATVLDNKKYAAGLHTLSLNSYSSASGCLIARLVTGAGQITKFLTITK